MQKEKQSVYMASSLERKRVIVMYLFFGIFVSIKTTKLSKFESSHLAQAVWWWIVFILAMIVSSILLFLPIISIVASLMMIVLVWIRAFFAYKAWNWSMWFEKSSGPLYLFRGIGNRCLDLFDVNNNEEKSSNDDSKIDDSIKEELMK